MFKILTPIIVTFLSFSNFAGVGGIAGGNSKFQTGDKILFQKHSYFVSANYSRSLCHDGHDYMTFMKKCLVRSNDDDRECLESEIQKVFQPMESKRRRCSKYSDDRCIEWIEVPFIQSPKRIVVIKDDDGNIKEKKKVVIPKCRD